MNNMPVWRWNLIVPLVCLFHGAAAVAGEFTLRQLMAELSDVRAVDAEFREVKTLEILQEPLVMTGTLRYRAPDRLVKQVLEPRKERVEIDGDRVVVTDGGGEPTVLSLDEHPALRAFVESFRATLAGDLVTLEHYYEVRLKGNAGDWTLRLSPRVHAIAAHVSSITLHGQGARVRSIVTLGVRGTRSVMTIEPAGS